MWAQSPAVTLSSNFSRFSLDECGLPLPLFAVDISKHIASFSYIKVSCQSSREKETLGKVPEKEIMNLEELLLQKIAHWSL